MQLGVGCLGHSCTVWYTSCRLVKQCCRNNQLNQTQTQPYKPLNILKHVCVATNKPWNKKLGNRELMNWGCARQRKSTRNVGRD